MRSRERTGIMPHKSFGRRTVACLSAIVTTERLAEISEAEYEKLMKFAEAHPVYQTAYIASVFTRSDWKKAAQQGEDIVECANEFFKEQTA